MANRRRRGGVLNWATVFYRLYEENPLIRRAIVAALMTALVGGTAWSNRSHVTDAVATASSDQVAFERSVDARLDTLSNQIQGLASVLRERR